MGKRKLIGIEKRQINSISSKCYLCGKPTRYRYGILSVPQCMSCAKKEYINP
jgi:hypothetical protein